VVFQATDGYRGARATVTADNTLSVDPIPNSLGAHVVAGALRGGDYRIYSLSMGQPMLFAPDSILMAGSEVTLAGRHLDTVERVTLGNQELLI